MKRFVIAIILFVLAIATSITCYIILNRRIDTLYHTIDDLLQITETEKKTEVERKTQELQEMWESSSKILHMFTMHRTMEEIELNILVLPDQLKDDDLTNFRESCQKAKWQLENLRDSERVSLHNIV